MEDFNIKHLSHLSDKKYIFPEAVRKYYKVFGTLGMVGLLCFTLFMLGIAIKQETDKLPCFLISAIFCVLFIGYLAIWTKNYHLIDATYYMEDSVAVNCIDKLGTKISVGLHSAIFTHCTLSFHLGNASLNVGYTIISDNLHSAHIVNDLETDNIFKQIEHIWEAGSVIVPK